MAAETRTEPVMDPGQAAITPARTRSGKRGRWRFLVLLAIAGGLAWAAFAFFSKTLDLGGSAASRGALTYEVGRSSLQVLVTEDGNVESASNIEVKCRVAGGSTILWIVEDGKVVEEGEEIVRLDTSAIDDKLNSQRIVYEKALATEIQARENLEAAKITVKEYEEGTFIELSKQVEAGIRIALENLRTAENQLNYSKRMVRKGFVSSLQREADEFSLERAKLDLDAANTRKMVLVEFTKEKTLRDLVAKREAAAATLRSEQAGLQLEKARLDRLQDQLKNCVITAPKKGMVVYANDPRGSRFGGGSDRQSQIEEGAMVRESQAFVRLPDLTRMLVKVTIHETHVEQVRPGMPARVFIQDQELAGKVLSVANQPQPSSWFAASVKEYATTISIEGETNGLRPGMSAKVTILIKDLKDVLCLPVSAVVEQKGQFFCWVKGLTGPERRPLKLGHTNDKLIELVDGVKEGEVVYRNPRAMVEEARDEPPFEKQSEDAKFKDSGGAESIAEPAKGVPPPPVGSPGAGEQAPSVATPPGPGAPAPTGSEPRGEGQRGDGPPGGDPSKRSGKRFDIMQFDKNGDKKVTREEAPEQMQGMFDRVDTNGDGSIDEAEIAEMRQRRPGGGRGGPGGRGGEGPGGGGRPEGPNDGGGGVEGGRPRG
jgi:HlyD family secretion protein